MVSRNRLMNGPASEEEKEIPEFAKVIYHKLTGEPKMFRGNDKEDECIEALASGEYVDTPAKSEKGKFERKPKECQFYKSRTCSLCPETYADKTGDFDGVELFGSDPKKREPSERPESETSDKTENNEAYDPPPLPNPNEWKPPKPPKYISQMNRDELLTECELRKIEIDPEDPTKTKRVMVKLINEHDEENPIPEGTHIIRN